MAAGPQVGGYGTAGTAPYVYPRFLSAVEEYHPARDAWVTHPDSRSARYYLSAVGTTQGNVYAVGGYGVAATGAAATFNESVLATVEMLDPTTGVWTRKSDLPQAAYGIGLGIFGCTPEDGGRCKLLAVGGYAAGEACNPYGLQPDAHTQPSALSTRPAVPLPACSPAHALSMQPCARTQAASLTPHSSSTRRWRSGATPHPCPHLASCHRCSPSPHSSTYYSCDAMCTPGHCMLHVGCLPSPRLS